MRRYIRVKNVGLILLLLISGVFTGLTLVCPELGFIEWISISPAAFFLLSNYEKMNKRQLFKYGFFFFFCFYVVSYHWFVYLYPLDFIDGMTPISALIVVIAATFGLSAFQALGSGAVFVISGLLFKSRIAKKYSLLKPVLAACIWCVFEWC